MPIADLKGEGKLVRFKWSYHRDRVTVYGFDAEPSEPALQTTKFKKTDAQKRFFMEWNGQAAVVETAEQAIRIVTDD